MKHLEAIMKDPRVVESVLLYPKRNITFTSDEKDLVLSLFDVIMKVIIEDVTVNDSEIILLAATVTKKVLSNHTIFSELIVGTIEKVAFEEGKCHKQFWEKSLSEFRS